MVAGLPNQQGHFSQPGPAQCFPSSTLSPPTTLSSSPWLRYTDASHFEAHRTLSHVFPVAWHFLAPLLAWRAPLRPRIPASVSASLVDPSPKGGPSSGLRAAGGSWVSRSQELRGDSICMGGRGSKRRSPGSVDKTELSNRPFQSALAAAVCTPLLLCLWCCVD